MNVYEFLKTHSDTILQLNKYSIKEKDVCYLDMYKEYMDLLSKHFKKTYITSLLSEKYGIEERTIYRVIKRFAKEITI